MYTRGTRNVYSLQKKKNLQNLKLGFWPFISIWCWRAMMFQQLVVHLASCLLLLLSVLKVEVAHAYAPIIVRPGCQDTCGNVSIPFPYGIGVDCFLDQWYEIECKPSPNSNNSLKSPFLKKFHLEVMEVILDWKRNYWEANYAYTQKLILRVPPLNLCRANAQHQQLSSRIDLRGSPYNFSTQDNVFLLDGCPGNAVLVNQSNTTVTGCGTVCHNNNSAISSKNCYGFRCCQTPLPGYDHWSPLQFYQINFNPQSSGGSQNCLVATLIKNDSVNDYVGKLSASDPSSAAPIVLLWSWVSNRWPDANHDAHCSRSEETNITYCYCDHNSYGNPYVFNGCNVPENCTHCKGHCRQNSGQSYYCVGDDDLPLAAYITIYVFIGLVVTTGPLLLVFGGRGLYHCIKRRRKSERRVKFFKMKLQQQLPSNEVGIERTKIFTKHELEKATNHFNENRILGRGGQGIVYKGMLTDGRIVAVKKSKLLNESQMEQFINEVAILSQLNHRNVVKLLGCCLETEVPLLVHEFIPNGTLAQHIHDPGEGFVISWAMRLKIAADSAGAIAYLHSSSSIPIYHRDIKSSNILLDEKYKAKVSDFGSSKTIAIDQTHLTTHVQGTMGYLDPEYFQSYQFTEKSDVYSFGVVLLELLTRKRPIYRDETMEQKSLVTEFLYLMEHSQLSSILDSEVVKETKQKQLIAFVDLAKRCLSESGKLRPTMKEVAMTLEMIVGYPSQDSTSDQQSTLPAKQFGEIIQTEISEAEFMSNLTLPSASSSIDINVQPLLP